MKNSTLFLILLFSINSFFSQENKKLVETLVIEKDSLKRELNAINKLHKELSDKFEDETKNIEKIKKENKELKAELTDIKKVSYSKEEYANALAKKDQEIEVLKKEFKKKEEQLQSEKKKLEDTNKSTLSILSEMNGTFFEKKIRDNYTLDFIKNHPFKREDSLNFKKYDAMIVSLNADPSMAELKSSKILEKASIYNDYYFKLLEVYSTFDFAYDSIKVQKALTTLTTINIPSEYEGLILSKAEILKRLTDYCKMQSDLFKNLKVMDRIQDKNQRYNKIEPVSKLEKFKHYKYLRETILQYANDKFDLPETSCISK
jgi:hypothetical protein